MGSPIGWVGVSGVSVFPVAAFLQITWVHNHPIGHWCQNTNKLLGIWCLVILIKCLIIVPLKVKILINDIAFWEEMCSGWGVRNGNWRFLRLQRKERSEETFFFFFFFVHKWIKNLNLSLGEGECLIKGKKTKRLWCVQRDLWVGKRIQWRNNINNLKGKFKEEKIFLPGSSMNSRKIKKLIVSLFFFPSSSFNSSLPPPSPTHLPIIAFLFLSVLILSSLQFFFFFL